MTNSQYRQWLRDIAIRAYYGRPIWYISRGLLLIEAMNGFRWPFAFPRKERRDAVC
jgi:hypothetical protein